MITNLKTEPGIINHPIFSNHKVKLPSKGRLKWMGGNLALDYPVNECVLDSCGKVLNLSLDEVLSRLDEFEGYRGGMHIKDNILSTCFIAYQYHMFTAEEQLIFEAFVRENVKGFTGMDAAKALLVNR